MQGFSSFLNNICTPHPVQMTSKLQEHLVFQPQTKKKFKKKRLQSAKKKKLAEDEEPLVPILPIPVTMATDVSNDGNNEEDGEKVVGERGLVNVLEKSSDGDVEEEITGQDMDSVNALERELKEESIMVRT